ncbi:MAG: aldehyde reductase [Alphaproteobacteria bacterium]|nr:aldehyde reductase [Alphaproteobacteria bacterium]
MPKVLVTGATGFIASHVVLELIERGYAVRGSARSADKADALNAILSDYAGKPVEIELVNLDLNRDEGWAEAMNGVDFVQHIASPFPPTQPESPDDLIIPARDGALRALKAAEAAGIKRVVLTSSVAAVDNGWGKSGPDIYDETSWTTMTGPEPVPAYSQSKTIAEQAAWDYVKGEGEGLELAVINPAAVLGPAMSEDVSTSLSLVSTALGGTLPAFPPLAFGVVDVRDIAKAHVEAMLRPEAAGERFIMSAGELWFREVGDILREAYPDRKIPSSEMPVWLAKLFALFMPALKPSAHRLGRLNRYSNQKAREQLGIEFRSPQDAVRASAESLIKLGIF